MADAFDSAAAPHDAPPTASDSPPLLLVGHGTRDVEGQAEFGETARKLAGALPRTRVVPCCLELAPPTIDAGIEELVAAGADRFVVVPVMLFAGGHVRQDIPEAVAAAAARHPGLTWRQAPHLGDQPPLLRLSASRFFTARSVTDDAASGSETPHDEPVDPADVCLALIGRGGGDVDAREEMRAFAAARDRLAPVRHRSLGFLAGPGPGLTEALDEALDAARRTGARRIVVQPHLLFQGRLVRQVREATRRCAAAAPDVDWRLAEHLGPADEVISTLVGNYGG